MASPIRQSPSEPPALHDRAIQDLSFIRRTMEGASAFTDVPGWGLVIIGLTAIAAAGIASTAASPRSWLTGWMLEAVIAAVIGSAMMWRKLRRRRTTASGAPVLSVPARKFLFGFWPGIFAGAVLTFALIDPRVLSSPYGEVPRVLPGLWLLLYGVSVTTAGAFSVRAVPLMGAGLILFGAVALLAPGIPGNLMMALGFGVWQIAFGVWIARRHGG